MAIAASIKEWGWTTLALVGEDGGLIAGHARVLAARQLGIVEVPVMVAAGCHSAQRSDAQDTAALKDLRHEARRQHFPSLARPRARRRLGKSKAVAGR